MDSSNGQAGIPVTSAGGQPLLISGEGAGGQPLVLSAEDAAQLLAQAGIQLGDNEQVIIGGDQQGQGQITLQGGQQFQGLETSGLELKQELMPQANAPAGTQEQVDDGTVLYIDPNDPQAAEILQQAGLRLAEDGTVISLTPEEQQQIALNQQQQQQQIGSMDALATATAVATGSTELLTQPQIQQQLAQQQLQPQEEVKPIISLPQEPVPPSKLTPVISGAAPRQQQQQSIQQKTQALLSQQQPEPPQQQQQPLGGSTVNASPSNTGGKQVVTVGPDQQQVLYTVTGEDGKTQQYMMLCPKDMDQNLLIQTLVKQISSDPATKGGKKTIRITQQKSTVASKGSVQPAAAATPSTSQAARQQVAAASPQFTPKSPSPVKRQSPAKSPVKATPRARQSYARATPASAQRGNMNAGGVGELIESVLPDLPLETADGSTRVYVRCNYCPEFRSSLNGETWESILNHILPVSKEEIQTGFYGDLGKHFIRSLRVQVNGKQIIRTGGGKEIPQCEVILTHSLVCRKTKREFVVSSPDAAFVANLAKHIRTMQPGYAGRGNSLLCIFCNSPFTYEDYIRHIQPHLDAILATLNCFAGAYCSKVYEDTIRAAKACMVCSEPEAADLRFLPCTKFSSDYACVKKLQFAIDCFREHYGDNGFLRLNTSTVCRCSVCKNTAQVYCAVFHISTTVLSEDGMGQTQQDVDTQLAVCVNCQKQFINIVMKEQGFDERLKVFQLKNMEQLCSVLRVILNQASAITEQKKTLIYTVHENITNPNSAVHMVKTAEVTESAPITKLMSLAESEVAGSDLKVFFICDLCLFTVDLTSLMASPKEKQKNDMLLAIVLEHLVPHTESLMNVIASTASNQTFSLKYELMARATDVVAAPAHFGAATPSHRKIVLSLAKKFKSSTGALEIPFEKEEEKTLSAIRNGIKSEKKNYVAVRNVRGPGVPVVPLPPPPNITAPMTPGGMIHTPEGYQGNLVELNKFIDKQRGKLGTLSQTGCNTNLLNAYVECKLCSKFSFPDFRLTGAGSAGNARTKPKSIDLCENCVETVLTLCLPTEPECLQEAEECLAIGEPKMVGHRLVLSNNLKKWLSLDGVNLIKKTVDDYDDTKSLDCSNLFLEALKKHSTAVLKTCQKDDDITSAVAGFCVNDAFLALDKGPADKVSAEAMASLEQQIGMPIQQAKTNNNRIHEVHVTILSRRPKQPVNKFAQRRSGTFISNGKVITLASHMAARSPANQHPMRKLLASASAAAAASAKVSTPNAAAQEESVSAIQNFLDSTATPKSGKSEVNLPPGIKITSAGKGLVNIRAVADSGRSSGAQSKATPKSASSVRGMKGVSAVTMTANGTVKRVGGAAGRALDMSDEEENEEEEDEGDSDAEDNLPARKRVRVPPPGAAGVSPDKDDGDYRPARSVGVVGSDPGTESEGDTPSRRNKRQRKEKKIFDL